MTIQLQLDSNLKTTLEELFITSAQAPAIGIENSSLAQDSLAVFRIAKEFTLNSATEESHTVEPEDIVRTLRFTLWLMTYGGELFCDSTETPTNSRNRRLQNFFAATALQAQSQYPNFETLLRSYGVDRQLNPKANTHKTSTHHNPTTTLSLSRTDKTHEVKIQTHADKTEMTSLTNETTWTGTVSRT